MEQARANWNDDRLDRLAEQVDKRFEEVDRRFDRLEDRIVAQGEHFDARFDALQQAMIITLASMLVAFAGISASLHF
jgi:DNA-binding Lrp family transcriptional regulator